MEGLIRGLMDVALGGGADGDGDGRRSHRRSGGDQAEEEEAERGEQGEKSRSSWAEVVASGEQDAEGEPPARRHQQRQDYTPTQQHQHLQQEQRPGAWGGSSASSAEWDAGAQEGHGGPDGGGGAGGSHGDWETVGDHHKKHQHQPRPQAKVAMNSHQWGGYKRPPSEQEYTPHIDGTSVDMEPTQEELHDLSKACSRLWELDLNRLVPGKDYEIDCGEGTKAYQKEDMSQASLFSWLSEDVFRRPTYCRFCSLLDNYNPSEGCKEVVTPQEKHEQLAFIEEISRTAPIKYLHKCLVARGIVSRDLEEFKRMLMGLWFDLYGRGGVSGSSSAFEHVFVGEVKEKGELEVSGFHNWIQFYVEEAKGRVDYHGYIFPRRHGQNPDSETQLLTIQFEWNGVLKAVSSTLIGVSPEFEVALYTLCFYFGGEDNHVCLGPYTVNVKCYRHGHDKIGSAFPIAEY